MAEQVICDEIRVTQAGREWACVYPPHSDGKHGFVRLKDQVKEYERRIKNTH